MTPSVPRAEATSDGGATVLLAHPTGNQNSRHAARALAGSGVLHRFVTAAHFNAHGALASLLPGRVRVELARRDFSDTVPAANIKSVARLRELMRVVAGKAGWQALLRRETGWASVDQVYHAVDRAAARLVRTQSSLSAVYAYEDGALETFQVAQAQGLQRFYELPIGYWRAHRRFCREEAALQPAWAHTWHADADSEAKVRRKDEELALASHIIVPSRFVADTLKDYPGSLAPLSILPYGCPSPIAPDARSWHVGGRLKVLFVGGLSQRKGLSYLLDALEPLGDSVTLTIIGCGAGAALLGSQHRILDSVPHATVLEEMRQHDIFVFPTLFEGYSLAVSEALSQGLPVITTPNSGAADIIQNGVQGWIVPTRDSASITAHLQHCLNQPETVAKMGHAALALAASWTWPHYRERLSQIVLDRSQVGLE